MGITHGIFVERVLIKIDHSKSVALRLRKIGANTRHRSEEGLEPKIGVRKMRTVIRGDHEARFSI